MSAADERIVIVGGGPTALAAAGAYRDAGGEGKVTILSRESDPPYRRPPLTKDFLRGETGREELVLADRSWFEEQMVELRLETEIVELDLGEGLACDGEGSVWSFDRLLLATGAEPVVPSLPGIDDAAVQTIRRIGDSERLGELGDGDRVLVVGSGFIGCEAAASLAMRGAEVTVATKDPAPQAARLGGEVAERITGWLEELGVDVLGETELESVGAAGDQARRAHLSGRRDLVVERILLAVGISRNDGIARAAGIAAEDGIQVGPSMETADRRVLAAGDVAFAVHAVAGRRLHAEHWGEAQAMGEVAGRTMAGEDAAWSVVPGFWSTIGDHTIKYVGWAEGYDELRFEPGRGESFACWYGKDGEVVGLVAHEDDDAYDEARERIGERAPWS